MNVPKKFTKKPVTIEAMQMVGSNGDIHAVYQWVEQNTAGSFESLAVIEGKRPCPASGVSIDPRDGRMVIATLEGLHWVNLGDWVVRGVEGEFYPVKPDIFAKTYDGPVDDGKWTDKALHRSAITGQFVTGEFADDNPDTTITEAGR
jgi:hypothetical protein